MRFDKLTTPFQNAIENAQRLALSHSNQFIEAEHVLFAMLDDDGENSNAKSLLQRSGVNVSG